MIQLRDYQEDLINRTREAMKSHRNVLMQAPTGAGKTALIVHMMGVAASRGKRSYFLVHQNELLQQTSEALWKQKLSHGMICPGRSYSKLPVQVASIQTLVRRLDKYPEPDLIVVDESHRISSASYQKVIEHYPKARVIGLTASPARTDGKGLDWIFSSIVQGPTVRNLIDRGFLADYDLIAPPIAGVNIDSVKTKMGDYDRSELEAAVDKPSITGDAVSHYVKYADGKRCVSMCVSIKHAEHVRDQYLANGIPAESIDGNLTGAERKEILSRFKEGKTLVITNVNLLIEGVDIPSIEVVQWLRPTQSLIVYLQGNGRGLRPSPGKEKLLILDHVSNWHRHGLPDEDREWSLEGKKKGKRKAKEEAPDVSIQMCEKCYHVFVPGPTHCPSCGEALPKKGRAELEVVEGELEKIDLETMRKERKQQQGKARTLEDLIVVGIRQKMNNPAGWAANILAARAGRKPTGRDFGEAKAAYAKIKSGATGEGVF